MAEMTDEQRIELIRLLEQGEDISPEWARILFPPEKREYELIYHGKDREEDILADTLAVPLQPVRTFGKNGNDWHNMLIFGDNLQVMKSLLDLKKAGKLCNADGTPGIRLVYIDPPFASRQEFRGNDAQKAYQDKISGALFLEFIRQRLVFIKQLLSADGTVYVHLDYRKLHYIKALGDEVFGEDNFMNEIIWCYRERGISKTFWNNKHQTILAWAKKIGTQKFFPDAVRMPYSEEYLKKFKEESSPWLWALISGLKTLFISTSPKRETYSPETGPKCRGDSGIGYATGYGISIVKNLSRKPSKAASENGFWVKARSVLSSLHTASVKITIG